MIVQCCGMIFLQDPSCQLLVRGAYAASVPDCDFSLESGRRSAQVQSRTAAGPELVRANSCRGNNIIVCSHIKGSAAGVNAVKNCPVPVFQRNKQRPVVLLRKALQPLHRLLMAESRLGRRLTEGGNIGFYLCGSSGKYS